MTEGYFGKLRGRLQCREHSEKAGHFTFISGGTLTAAMIAAREADPSNPQVVSLASTGHSGGQ